MNSTLVTALVEENQLLRYLKSSGGADQTKMEAALTKYLYWSLLTALSNISTESELREAASILRSSNKQEQESWILKQPPAVTALISETIDRVFLSLEKKI